MDISPSDAHLHHGRDAGADTAGFLIPLQVYSFQMVALCGVVPWRDVGDIVLLCALHVTFLP